MTATVVVIKERFKHPNADTLYIYKVSNGDDINDVQVVANNSYVYEVGNNANYIRPGSILLQDGLKIKERKIRDIMSYGMLSGPSILNVGMDITDDWCKKELESVVNVRTNLKHQKWPSIEAFANIRKTIYRYKKMGYESPYFNTTYVGKIKLHGTNAAVQISSEGEVVAQKRTQVIYPDQDNAGFARWVSERRSQFAKLAPVEGVITLHGEWAGPSIHKGVALSQIPNKIFAIFCLQYGRLEDGSAEYIINPKEITKVIGDGPYYILPYHHEIDIDFCDDLSAAKVSNSIETQVLQVEAKDPWVFENFAIEGVGEGLVYYPRVEGRVKADDVKELFFKAKGYKHQVNNNKTPNIAAIDIEKLDSIHEFSTMFVTTNRLLQGVKEACNDEYDTRLIGTFLKWVAADIQKESTAQLEISNLTWKAVSKYVMTVAREWYQSKI